jgi:hypothetical protein
MPLHVEQFVSEKNKRQGSEPLLLVEIEYTSGTYFRIAKSVTDVTFDGETWVAFGFEKPRRSQNSRAEIPTFDLVLANPERVVGSILENYIVEGKTGRLITVHRDHLDDPTAKFEEWFEVKTADVHEKTITLTCKGVRGNPRRMRVPSSTMTRSEYPGLAGATKQHYF